MFILEFSYLFLLWLLSGVLYIWLIKLALASLISTGVLGSGGSLKVFVDMLLLSFNCVFLVDILVVLLRYILLLYSYSIAFLWILSWITLAVVVVLLHWTSVAASFVIYVLSSEPLGR